MKNLIILSLTLGMVVTAHATIYSYTWSSGFDAGTGVIPDGNPTGWSDTRELSGIPMWSISDVNVRLNISGGWNGDLYGYLVHESGFTVLLNRVGTGGAASEPQYSFGWSTSGFGSIALDDDTANANIHAVEFPAGGPYKPDSGSGSLASFDTLNPNGSWTLFFADLAAGDTSTVVSWGLDIEAVPEPVTWALGVFGVLAIGAGAVRRWRTRAGSARDARH